MATAVRVQEKFGAAEPSQWILTLRRFRKHKLGVIGFFTLVVLVLSVIFIPMISGWNIETIDDAALKGEPPFKPVWWTSPARLGDYDYEHIDPVTGIIPIDWSKGEVNPVAGKLHILGTDNL